MLFRSFLNGYAADPNGLLSWPFGQEQGLGMLGDAMSHVFDMARMLAGPLTRAASDREIFIRQCPIAQPGSGTHYDVGSSDAPKGDVTNEDYVSALEHFANGAHGILESCLIIHGEKCDLSLEINGTRVAIKWNMECMNELQLQWRNDENALQDG